MQRGLKWKRQRRGKTKVDVSMQRGLKYSLILQFLQKFTELVSMQRGLKFCFSMYSSISCSYVSMQRGLKSSYRKMIIGGIIRSQCKEDWNTSRPIDSERESGAVSMQRGLKSAIPSAWSKGRLNVSMQRGLKCFPRTRKNLLPGLCLNAKRIEMINGLTTTIANPLGSQCKEDWNLELALMVIIARILVSMQRGLKLGERVSPSIGHGYRLNAKRIEMWRTLSFPEAEQFAVSMQRGLKYQFPHAPFLIFVLRLNAKRIEIFPYWILAPKIKKASLNAKRIEIW